MKLTRHTPEMIERYLRNGWWGREPTQSEAWDRSARDHPDKEALVDARNRVTFAQGKRWYDRVALGLMELGLKKDDIVLRQLPNSAEAILLGHALEKAGILSAIAVTQLRHAEIEHILNIMEAVGVFIVPRLRDVDYYQMIQDVRPNVPSLKYIFVVGDEVPPGTISIDEMAERPVEGKYPSDYYEKNRWGADEVSGFGLTSGTTGLPKIVVQAGGTGGMIPRLVERWKITGDDINLIMAPYFGGGGVPSMPAPYVGTKVVLMERFDAEEALRLIEKERCTIASGVPTQMVMMLNHPNFDRYDYSSLRAFYYAAAHCPYSVAEAIEEKMGCRIISMYGQFEAGGIATTSIDDPPEIRRTSPGKLFPYMEARLVDEGGNDVPRGEAGQVLLRGGGVCSGYYRDAEATAATWVDEPDGWLKTGDLGRFDEEGNIYLVGREKDMINRGGRHIFPADVENVLATHPKVLNCSIVAMPDPVMGEKACAYVILKTGEGLTFDEMVSFLGEKDVATYKLPERLEIMDKFPMSGDGLKVLKRELTEDVTRKLKAEGKVP